MNITGNTIFIAGATSGIGLALARRLKKRGNSIIVGGRRTELLAELREEGFSTMRIDTADAQSITSAAEAIIAEHPALNVVVAMAGIMPSEDWHSPEGFLQTAEHTVTVNLLGPIRLTAAFIEHLQAQPASTLITVSSGLAHVPRTSAATYSATKAAIHVLSESIRAQLADTTVQVIELVPPAVRTDLLGTAPHPRVVPLDQFAEDVIELLEHQPEAKEILVDQVDLLRRAERRGDYDTVFDMVNGIR